MRFVARHYRVLLSVACLVGAALWWQWDRFGPPVPQPENLADMDPEVARLVRQALAAAERRRGDEDLRLQLGMVYEANGLQDHAKTCYEQVLQARPEDVKAWYRLGRVRLHTGDFAGAIEAMRRVTDLEPDFVEAYAQAGLWLLDSGEPEEARRQLQQAVELDPDNEAAGLGLVLLHLQRGAPDEAIALLEDKQLLERRNRGYAHQLLAMAHRQRGDLEEAQRALAHAGSLRPDWSDPYARELAGFKVGTRNKRAAASALMSDGRHAEALPLLLQARSSQPQNTRILNTLATCYLELKRFDLCFATLAEALRIDPEDYWTNVNLANAYWTAGQSQRVDLSRALAHAETAVAQQPDSGEAHTARGRILMALQRREEAIDALKHAFALDARDPSVLTQAGILECELARWDQAVETFRAVLEHERLSATPLVGLAMAHMGRGEIEQAESLLAEARARRPDHPQLLESAAGRLAELKGAAPADGGGA